MRVGAAATFTRPVVLDFRNNTWKFQPTAPGDRANGAGVATFANTRTATRRQTVGGDLKIGDVQRAQLLQHHR